MEWKERIYHDYISDIDDALKCYLNDMLKIKNNLGALDVNLMDSFEENVQELGEMMGWFKENYQNNIREIQNIYLESFKGLCHLQMHTTAFETEMDEMHKNIATTDGLNSKWRTRLCITTIPEDPGMKPIINMYHEYIQMLKAQEVSRDDQEVEIVGNNEPEAE